MITSQPPLELLRWYWPQFVADLDRSHREQTFAGECVGPWFEQYRAIDPSTLGEEACLLLVHEMWQALHAEARLRVRLQAATQIGSDADADTPRLH